MADFNYIPNGGQTYIPFRENVHVPQPEFTPLGRPQPPLPDFQLTHEAQDKGWVVASPCQHFLPGVEPEMLDWWWANMEKGYYLWLPPPTSGSTGCAPRGRQASWPPPI